MIEYPRPEPLPNGTPEAILNHAIDYGAWCQKLENQVKTWQKWHKENESLP